MSATEKCRKPHGAALGLTALVGALLIAGCSDRDTKLAEATATANRAAERAEKAAERAEAAANKAGSDATAPVVIEEPEDDEAKALEEQNQPPSTDPDGNT